jgi:hypothetical protein
MNNNRNVFLGAAGILIILVIIAVTSGLHSTKKVVKDQIKVSDYAQTDVAVRLTIEGPIGSNESHQSTVITIARGSRTTQFYHTYNNELVAGQSYENNQAAYEQFVYALQYQGFTQQNKKSTQDDDRGLCPTGQHYIYEIVDGDTTIMRLWSDSCSDPQHTFAGNGPLIRQLFRNQIPDYTLQTQAAAKLMK